MFFLGADSIPEYPILLLCCIDISSDVFGSEVGATRLFLPTETVRDVRVVHVFLFSLVSLSLANIHSHPRTRASPRVPERVCSHAARGLVDRVCGDGRRWEDERGWILSGFPPVHFSNIESEMVARD